MERTQCEKCGKWAIKVPTGMVLTSYPVQYPQVWKCACGWSKDAGVIRGESSEDTFNKNWNLAQH